MWQPFAIQVFGCILDRTAGGGVEYVDRVSKIGTLRQPIQPEYRYNLLCYCEPWFCPKKESPTLIPYVDGLCRLLRSLLR